MFEPSWITENSQSGGGYENQWGDNFKLVGIFILLLLIISVKFAIFDDKNKRAALILLMSGLTLLIIRFLHLKDIGYSFYEPDPNGKTDYVEIPLGFFYAIIFGSIDLLLIFLRGKKTPSNEQVELNS